VSVLKPELSGGKDKHDQVANKVSRSVDDNRKGIELVLELMNLVTAACETALLSTNRETRKACIYSAKKSYAAALLRAGRLSFEVKDVHAFELSSVGLESVISRLEGQYRDQEPEPRSDPSMESQTFRPNVGYSSSS
jgi:hypothetical protein